MFVRNKYVPLWDPESTKFQCYLGPSPRDWRTLIHFNVVGTVFHIDHMSQEVCKTVRPTFQYIFVLQFRGEGPENLSRICPIVMCFFRTSSPQLENNDTSKCSSDSFAHTLRYVINVENCQNYIKMYQYPPIVGRRSLKAEKFGGLRISECSICYMVIFRLCKFKFTCKFILEIKRYWKKLGFSEMMWSLASRWLKEEEKMGCT